MKRNKLRELLKAGKPTVGTHLHSSWPNVVEAVGHTGMYDYIEFVAEYVPFDLYALDNICRAAELHGLGSMIKVDQEPRRFLTQRAIGSGFDSVLFADVRSADDARECVRAARPETPEGGGVHGVAARRISYMGYACSPEYVAALNDVVVVLMIEKKAAVDHLEEILAVPGIDMIQWGPSDYSMSIGMPEARNSAEVKAVERHVLETAMRMGIPPRAEILSPDAAGYYLDMGIRHFCMNTDLTILYNWWRTNGDSLRKTITGRAAEAEAGR